MNPLYLKVGTAVAGGVVGAIAGLLLVSREEPEVYSADGPYEVVERVEAPNVVGISKESYYSEPWSQRLVASYFIEDGILGGFDESLCIIHVPAIGGEEYIAELKKPGDEVHFANMATKVAYEVLCVGGSYEDALEEAKAEDVEAMEAAVAEAGYSNDAFDQVVTSLGD